MEAQMPCSNPYKDPLRVAAEWLDQYVIAIRNRGYTKRYAIKQASQHFGVSRRRVEALIYGQAFAMPDDEFKRVLDQYLCHLDEDAEAHAARSAEARALRQQTLRDFG
jgi:hypothetical protein